MRECVIMDVGYLYEGGGLCEEVDFLYCFFSGFFGVLLILC